MFLRQVSDSQLAQNAYLIGCQNTGEALLIDPERDVDRYVELARAEGLRITAVAETHVHADFLSGARQLAEDHGAALYLPAERDGWGARWAKEGGYDAAFLSGGDTFHVGNVKVEAVHTPGHTPEHISLVITDGGGGADAPMGLVTGDFVFVGDLGRPDLLESAAGQKGAMADGARALFASAQAFLERDDYLQVWPGHGAGSACGKALGSVPETTVGYERRFSPALRAAQEGEDAFVGFILEDQPEPPLYFARMKEQNRDGVPLLEALPQPRALSTGDLDALGEDVTVIDARTDREEFGEGHLPGAIYAPFGKSFPTIAGSYATPDERLVLVIAEEHVEPAVRSLIRVGLDRVEAYATPQTLAEWGRAGALDATPIIDVEEMESARHESGAQVVDVRSLSEYRGGHVPGAILAPHTRLPEQLDTLPKDKTLLVHCGSGQRASSAASLLAAHGFDAQHVDDLFSKWADAHPDAVEEGEPRESTLAA